jgi:two-component system, cell cycle response regulator
VKPRDRDRDTISDAEEDRTIVTKNPGQQRGHGRDHPFLIVLAGTSLGQMFRIDSSGAVVGRGADADVRLQDDGMSRRHAQIVISGREVYIEDLGSVNGTLVNDERVTRALLHDGDKIQMGSTTVLKFTYTDELEEDFQKRMHDAALYDPLTKACNRQHLLHRMQVETSYAKRHSSALSLLMIDIDHFKQINDRYGHPAGDYVLARLGGIVADMLRAEDLFARYGGEEFAVLCRATSADRALILAERLRERVQATSFDYQGEPIRVTISVGVAAWFEQPDSVMRLVADADHALYKAKAAGRNRVIVKAAQDP